MIGSLTAFGAALMASNVAIVVAAESGGDRHNPQAETQQFFLRGMEAVQRGDYRAAIDHFRAGIVLDPAAPRLRLELARAYFLAKDYSNAEFQFRRALAGDVPPAVRANIEQFLDRIRREKTWSYEIGFGIAPDSNINSGSSASQTTLFGLPFELGGDAREKSGIGLTANASIQYAPTIGTNLKLQAGAATRHRDYGGHRYDDTALSLWAGPQWRAGNWELGLAATGLVRWYGGRRYVQAPGARAEATRPIGRRTAIALEGSWQHFSYPDQPAQDGAVVGATATMLRILSPTTSVTVQGSLYRQDARAKDLSNRIKVGSVSFTRDLPAGFTVTASGTYGRTTYEAADLFFGTRRRDRTIEWTATLLNRRVVLWRFTPTIGLTRSARASTIDLYDSRQTRLEGGLTSRF